MTKRFFFVVAFEGNLDGVPGAMHAEDDWHRLAMHEFLRQSQYGVKASVMETTDHRGVFGGWNNNYDGWNPCGNEMPDNISPETEVQFRTETMPEGYYHNGWHPAKDVWVEGRDKVVGASIVAYRTRKPEPAHVIEED
jgi:hypothetical protein